MGLFSALLGNAGTVSNADLHRDYKNLFVEGETVEIGFKLIRDVFIFTNKRMLLIDRQGLTGSKIEYKSVTYKSISRFSIETAGHFDLDAELKIWVSSETAPGIQKKFNKSVNIYEVQKILASHILT
ncbi:PH domain-containing protein [Niabella aquatica]